MWPLSWDGNGRWAKSRGLERWQGHKEGVDTVKRVVEASGEIGLKYLTLYTFSIENWNRPKEEISMLMGLMVDAILAETDNLMKQQVRVMAIGNLSDLPEAVYRKLKNLIALTSENTGVTLVLALSYGARWELLEAAKHLAKDYKNGKISDLESIDDENFASYLTTAGIPDPDLLIRTKR